MFSSSRGMLLDYRSFLTVVHRNLPNLTSRALCVIWMALVAIPSTADATANILDAWASDGTWLTQDVDFAPSAGPNRIVLVGIGAEKSGGIAVGPIEIDDVRLGNQSLTEISSVTVGAPNSYHNLLWLGYLPEDQIAARSGDTITATYTTPNGAPNNPFGQPKLFYASYRDIDQGNPIADSNFNTLGSAATIQPEQGGPGVSVVDGNEVVVFFVLGQPKSPLSPSGYTEEQQTIGRWNDMSASINRRTVTASGTENPTMTSSSSTRLAVGAIVLNGLANPTAPVVSITSPTDQSTMATQSATINLSGTAGDNTLVTSVAWANDRGGQGTAAGTDNWSVNSIALLSGDNRITVTAEDAAGNSGTDEIVVTYDPIPPPDVTAPVATITSPTDQSTMTTQSATINLGGTASDDTSVASVAWANDRGGLGNASGAATWSVGAIALQSGTNQITVTVTDAAGNAATDVLTVTYTPPDDAAPVIAITSPSSAGVFSTSAGSIMVSGTASDNAGVTGIFWRLNGGTESAAVGLDNWSTPVLLLDPGANTISITASDASGNDAVAEIVVTLQVSSPDVLRGIAILGDSNSDEYRADDNRGGAYAATTLNWMEQLALNRGLNFGAWDTRSEPRRTGYIYNWSRSGANAATMISSGQHTGVAAQVAAGDVTLVYMFIGVNDFNHDRFTDIYNGVISGQALTDKVNGMIANMTIAIDTVLAAGPEGFIVAQLVDYTLPSPTILANYPDPAKRQRVIDAVQLVNAGLVAVAQTRNIVLIDIQALSASIYGTIDQNGFLNIGGELIDAFNPGNEPHHSILGDTSGHAGTVANGLFANLLFIDILNNSFGTSLVPFSDEEILNAAGISP